MILPFGSSSQLQLSITVPEFYAQYINLQFYGHNLHSNTSHPLAAYFVLVLQVSPDLSIVLHRSEVIKDEKTPHWEAFKVPLFVLQQFHEGSIELKCYNFNVNATDSFIGHCRTTLYQLQQGPGAMNSYMLLDTSGVHIHEKTSLMLRRCDLTTGPTYFDLINKGIHLHLTEAVDMTASNGNPNSPDSLHFIHPHQPSAYLRSILSVTPPLLAYLANSRIAALGFGAKVGDDFKLSQCFYLNGSPSDAHVDGLVGLLNAYRTSRIALQPFAPTEFADCIYYVSTLAKAESRRRVGLYFCLLILTDGAPSNNKRTIDAIVDSSYFPCSVFAIGVGKKKVIPGMDILLSPTLKHSDGRALCRQNFMFVHSDDLDKENALALLPLQMIQWAKRFDSA
ncbi:hypothetical protein WR25_12501 isoform B [Diploscapter pachys]|uniref:Uncharacterized protein n=1 Tax=Diploscapter pachys TaxID=2018661 RepID=A0A2A2JDT2_9BILA|nr:hypothetical protein WR25_12501 isoform A [Diploscapter pachys]PAV59901.1 hypothetical protein WR25_12501 isoform B [Diploscapter pachys]